MKHAVAAFLGLIATLVLLTVSQAPASAQSAVVVTSCPASRTVPYPPGTLGMPAIDEDGNLCASTAGGGGGSSDVNINGVNGAPPSGSNPIWVAPAGSTAFPVLSAPRSAMTTAGCTVGTTSATCLAASTANFWIQVQNTHATNTIACSWGGTAALNASGSFMLAPGQSASWGVLTSGVPTNALNCIASAASTSLYVETR